MKVVVGVQELFYLLIQMEGQSCLLNVLRTGLQPVAQVAVPVTRLPVCDGNSSHVVVCVFVKWCLCVGMVDYSKSEMIVVGLNVTSSAAILCYKMSRMILVCLADDWYDMSSICSSVWCRAE